MAAPTNAAKREESLLPTRSRHSDIAGPDTPLNKVAFLPLLCRTTFGCSLHAAVTGQAMVGPPRGKRAPNGSSTLSRRPAASPIAGRAGLRHPSALLARRGRQRRRAPDCRGRCTDLGQLSLRPRLSCPLEPAALNRIRRVRLLPVAALLDQRRADDRVLPRRRHGNSARDP